MSQRLAVSEAQSTDFIWWSAQGMSAADRLEAGACGARPLGVADHAFPVFARDAGTAGPRRKDPFFVHVPNGVGGVVARSGGPVVDDGVTVAPCVKAGVVLERDEPKQVEEVAYREEIEARWRLPLTVESNVGSQVILQEEGKA